MCVIKSVVYIIHKIYYTMYSYIFKVLYRIYIYMAWFPSRNERDPCVRASWVLRRQWAVMCVSTMRTTVELAIIRKPCPLIASFVVSPFKFSWRENLVAKDPSLQRRSAQRALSGCAWKCCWCLVLNNFNENLTKITCAHDYIHIICRSLLLYFTYIIMPRYSHIFLI